MCLFQTTVKCMFQTVVKVHQSSLGFIKLTSDYMFQTAVKEQRSQGFYQAAVVMCVCLRLQSKLTRYVKVLLKCWCVCVFQSAVKGQQQSLTLYQANAFQCVFQTAVKTVP